VFFGEQTPDFANSDNGIQWTIRDVIEQLKILSEKLELTSGRRDMTDVASLKNSEG
jgi:hypothetical protein